MTRCISRIRGSHRCISGKKRTAASGTRRRATHGFEVNMRARSTVGAILWMLLLAAAASAQLSTAELAGTVRDSSGAVLPGVTVTVTQTDTGFTRTVVTDDSGAYLLPNLPTG